MNEVRNSPADRPWRNCGGGSMVTFKCGSCNLPRGTRESGMRKVRGLRTRVCVTCRDVIDGKEAPQ